MDGISPFSVGIVVLLLATCVAFVIEWRITSRPASEWTPRQRRFMAADARGTSVVRFSGLRIAPVVGLAACVLLVIVGIVQISAGEETFGGIELTVGIVAGVGMVLLLRRKPRIRTRENADSEGSSDNDETDSTSWQSPHPVGAIIAGLCFIAFGVATLLTTINSSQPEWLISIVLIICGVVIGISAIRTLRQR